MNPWNAVRSTRKGAKVYKLFIGGKWVDSSNRKTFDVSNPATGKLVARVQKATPDDALDAIESAYKTKNLISEMPAVERIELLEKIHELVMKYKRDIVDIIVQEAGKPVVYAEGEVKATYERLHCAAEEAKTFQGEYIPGEIAPDTINKFAIVSRKPRGVVLAISSFNYPLYISVTKIAPAIASGNSVILKAASDDPICTLMFARLAELAGVPRGVFNVVTGSSSEIGDIMVSDSRVNMISFTGSTYVGKHIAGIAGMKRLHLELGGKCPAIVLEDADLELAVKECLAGTLKFSGQRCDAVSRIIVADKIANDFVERTLEEIKKWKVGDPRDRKTKVGPLINQGAVEKVEVLVNDAVEKGAKLLLGGKKKDLYYYPTVLDNVNQSMRIAWEETFGPVATVIRVKDENEALEIANQSNYGLDACVFTRSVDKAVRIARKLEDGAVTINAHPSHGLGNFPFGGDKDSGIGREGLNHSIDEMTKLHTIVFTKVRE
jgi:acyl-CoA reductase-like NAD-dependent aldehyde dehydrogenase